MYNDYALIKKSTLTDTANAIRSRKGTSEPIDPANFASEINDISGSGGEPSNPVLQEKTVNVNGVVIPDDGYDGLSKVTVNIPGADALGHTEVASIVADGASYINTGIHPSPNCTIEMECRLHTIVDDRYDFLFGTRYGDNSRWQARFDNATTNEPNELRVQRSAYYNTTGSGNWINTGTFKADWLSFRIFKLSKNVAYIDGVNVGNSVVSSSTAHYPYPVYLFSCNDSDDGIAVDSGCAFIECKYVKLWDGDNLILDLIPVVKSDGTVCMFDKLNSAYYYNSGAGSFTYPTKPAVIDIDMNNDGVNLGIGGSTYDAVNHNGSFTDGKFVLDAPGCLTVPTEFMAKSSTKPWTVAFTMDNYTIGDEYYSRVARGNNDVPTVYFHNRESSITYGFNHKLVSKASYSTDVADRLCGTSWYDQDFYWTNTSGGLTFTTDFGTKTTFVFRHDSVNTELWINGVKRCVADSSLYTSEFWASTFSIGNDQYNNADTAIAGRNMNHLECSMLKLWDRAITDDEIALLCTPTTVEEAMYEYYGIDKEEYPYLYIASWYNSSKNWRIKPIFAKSINDETGVITDVLGLQEATTKSLTDNEYNNTSYYSNINTIFDYMKQSNITFNNSYDSYQTDNITDKCWYFTNWDATFYTNWTDLRTV